MPTAKDLMTLSYTGSGIQAQTVGERILADAAMRLTGTFPDGTPTQPAAFVSSQSTVLVGNQTTVNAAAPPNITANNLLVAIYYCLSSTATTLNTPAGWTLAGKHDGTSNFDQAGVYFKIATSSEPATYTFSSTGSGTTSVSIHQYSGGYNTVEAVAFNPTSSTSLSWPSVTATGTTDIWVISLGMGAAAGNGATTTPSGFTARENAASTNTLAQTWDQKLSASGPTGTASSTKSNSFFGELASFVIGISVLPPVAGYTSWYDASQLSLADGAAMASWADLGPGANTLTQGTGALQPNYYKTTGAYLINGHPAVRFNSTGPSFMSVSTSASQPFSTFAVWQPVSAANASNSYIVHEGGSFAGVYYTASPPNGIQLYFGANVNSGLTVTPGAAASVAASVNGASSLVSVNGVNSAALSPGAGGATDIGLGQQNAGNSMDSLYGEVLFYPFALTAPQLASLHTYAQTKWGIP